MHHLLLSKQPLTAKPFLMMVTTLPGLLLPSPGSVSPSPSVKFWTAWAPCATRIVAAPATILRLSGLLVGKTIDVPFFAHQSAHAAVAAAAPAAATTTPMPTPSTTRSARRWRRKLHAWRCGRRKIVQDVVRPVRMPPAPTLVSPIAAESSATKTTPAAVYPAA